MFSVKSSEGAFIGNFRPTVFCWMQLNSNIDTPVAFYKKVIVYQEIGEKLSFTTETNHTNIHCLAVYACQKSVKVGQLQKLAIK